MTAAAPGETSRPTVTRRRVRFPLDLDDVWEHASARAGCAVGARLVAETREPLGVLLDDLSANAAKLSAMGRHLASQTVIQAAEAAIRADAATFDVGEAQDDTTGPVDTPRPLEAPIVVGGMPRTGTTVLHRLVSHSRDVATISNVATCWPGVRPTTLVDGDAATAIDDARARITLVARLSPDVADLHPMSATTPDECQLLTQAAFLSLQYVILFEVPGYARYLCERTGAAIDAVARLAPVALGPAGSGAAPSVTGATSSTPRRRRAVLKSPQYLGQLAVAAERWPEMVLVTVDRDFGDAFASWCELIGAVRSMTLGAPDGAEIAREWSDHFIDALTRDVDALAHVDVERVGVPYEQLVAHPEAVVERLCAVLGLEAPSRAAMLSVLDSTRPPQRTRRRTTRPCDVPGIDEAASLWAVYAKGGDGRAVTAQP